MRGDGELLILVRDQGPGIAESQLEEVFKPFVRLDEARNTESGSVGLGLAIARTLVHQHGGELSLHNREEGAGSADQPAPVRNLTRKWGTTRGLLLPVARGTQGNTPVTRKRATKTRRSGFFNSC